MSEREAAEAMPTLPPGFADAALSLAAAPFRVTAVIQAVWDVAGFPLPVGFTLAVNGGGGVAHPALATARAVVGTCVDPTMETHTGRKTETRRQHKQ